MLSAAYDYVIVGGGTAGSVLASRLSECDDASVLLLEAGPLKPPDRVYALESFPADLLGSDLDWSYITLPQSGTAGTTHLWSKGKVLGGSSTINAMGHIRGHRAVYDGWATRGAIGWAYDDLLPYFKRCETAVGKDPAYRGSDGPLIVAPPSQLSPDAWTFRQALVEAGFPVTDDVSGRHQIGTYTVDMNVIGGRRQSAADAYLNPVMHRDNLTVLGDALVHRVRLCCERCTTVEFSIGDVAMSVNVRHEAVLCAGAVGSPQLLMLSGVGPAEDLRRHGIAVVSDLPGVGENLQDHIQSRVIYQCDRPIASAPTSFCPVSALTRSDIAPSDAPDVWLLLIDFPAGPLVTECPLQTSLPPVGFTIGFSQQAPPASRGSIKLAADDPAAPPVIDPRYYCEESDLAAMLDYLEVTRSVGATKALASWGSVEILPGKHLHNRAALRDYVRKSSGTTFHLAGTCRIGTDPMAVVDSALSVHGVKGLRVVDASVMPEIVNVNLNATVVAIAEKAADIIRLI